MTFFRYPPTPHVWRETFALLSLTAWTMVVVSWLIIHLIGWFVGPITGWNFVPPPPT